LRWTGLLRGRFEFGTLAFTRPSLILVQNAEGRWNLERWLPPAKTNNAGRTVFYGPAQATPANHLQKIEFDEGRVNFKIEYDKQAFAFTDVSGSVEQVAPGRWQLQIAATPWRSGVQLQSPGRIRVRGDLAGTSARLRPAQIQVHWTKLRSRISSDFGAGRTTAFADCLRWTPRCKAELRHLMRRRRLARVLGHFPCRCGRRGFIGGILWSARITRGLTQM
jgi:uncharacterized protein involved in outer membrane biogenesis